MFSACPRPVLRANNSRAMRARRDEVAHRARLAAYPDADDELLCLREAPRHVVLQPTAADRCDDFLIGCGR